MVFSCLVGHLLNFENREDRILLIGFASDVKSLEAS
jgi:hypothetical protein